MWAGLVMKQQLQPSVPAAVERLSTSGGTAAAAGVARSGAAPGDPAANGHRHLSPTAVKGGAPEFSAFQDAEAPAGGLGELSALPMADDPNDPVQEREFTHLMDGLAGAITINTNRSDLHASYVCVLEPPSLHWLSQLRHASIASVLRLLCAAFFRKLYIVFDDASSAAACCCLVRLQHPSKLPALKKHKHAVMM